MSSAEDGLASAAGDDGRDLEPVAPSRPVLSPTISTVRTLRFRIETDGDRGDADAVAWAEAWPEAWPEAWAGASTLFGAPKPSGRTAQASQRAVVRRLETGYFDTPDRFLFGHDLSLRVRRRGRRFIQRLALHDQGGRDAPLVWEWPVDGAAPDLSCLSASRIAGLSRPLAERLAQRLARAPVGPVFETRLRRRIRRLDLPDAVLDLVLDDGTLQAGASQEGLREIGLVLRSGETGLLYDLGARLLETGALHLNPLGIVRRGYALASGEAMRACKARPGPVTAQQAAAMPADDMIAATLLEGQAHLLANQPVAAEGRNPDGVHQMRVALRRLRSALSLYRRAVAAPAMRHFAAEAKWAADELGDARSWDVLLSATIEAPSRLTGFGADFEQMRRVAETPRAAAYLRARTMLDAQRYDRFQLSLGQWIARRGWRNEVDHAGLAILAEPAADLAARILARLHAKAVRQGKGFRRLSPEDRHALRITLKTLRYASEFFLPLFGESATARRYLRQLARLQDALGLDQDAATTQPLLDALAARDAAPGLHRAIGVIAGWQARATLANQDALIDSWRRFKALAVFWPAAAARQRDVSPSRSAS
jgi:triphosphatase